MDPLIVKMQFTLIETSFIHIPVIRVGPWGGGALPYKPI